VLCAAALIVNVLRDRYLFWEITHSKWNVRASSVVYVSVRSTKVRCWNDLALNVWAVSANVCEGGKEREARQSCGTTERSDSKWQPLPQWPVCDLHCIYDWLKTQQQAVPYAHTGGLRVSASWLSLTPFAVAICSLPLKAHFTKQKSFGSSGVRAAQLALSPTRQAACCSGSGQTVSFFAASWDFLERFFFFSVKTHICETCYMLVWMPCSWKDFCW